MVNFLKKYILIVEKFNEKIGKTAAWLNVFLLLLMCVDVFTRYLFRFTTVAILDLEWYFFSLIFLFGAAYTLKEDKHVRVDVFYNRLSPKNKAWVDFIGGIFLLIPFCVVVIYVTYKFTSYSYFLNEGSADPGGLPARYLIKAAIPLGFIFLLLQAIASVFTALLTILGEKPAFYFKDKKGGESHA